MAEARAMIAAGERVGVLFGPERAGLETADVVRANAVVSVPVNPAYGSLNLAQCVLLLAYEWLRAAGATPAAELPAGRRRGGRRGDRGRPLPRSTSSSGSTRSASSSPRRSAPSMIANLDNLFRRAPLTDADVRTLHGVVRALAVKVPGRK